MKIFKLYNLEGFTITELLVVVVIMAALATFAIPNYQESIRKAHERDAIRQLKILHEANQIYLAAEEEFLPGTNLTITDINTAFDISLSANEMIFDYDFDPADPLAYIASYTWQENGVDYFTVQIDQRILGNNNPCCAAGPCKLATAACP